MYKLKKYDIYIKRNMTYTNQKKYDIYSLKRGFRWASINEMC